MNEAASFDDLLSQAGDRYLSAPAEAEAMALQALAMRGPDAAPRDRVRALRTLGLARAYNGQAVQAVSDLESALDAVPAGEAGCARRPSVRCRSCTTSSATSSRR